MGATFASSDHHFWHKAINGLADRPFASTEECAAEMIRRHNKRVSSGDRTFLLGDFWFGPRDMMREVVEAMNGSLVLVLGNHDRGWAGQTNGFAFQREYLDAGFEAVVDMATLTLPQVKGGVPARKVMLSHFPYRGDHTREDRHNQFRLRDEGAWLIHGHVHGLYTVRNRGVNVGVDVWDFYPVQDHEIARLINDVETGARAEF